MKKAKNYLKKPPNDLKKLNPDFSEEGKEERPGGSSYDHSIWFRKSFQF